MTDFKFYTKENAPAEAKPMLEQIQQGFGFVPNMFGYMAEAPTTIEAYLSLNNIIAKTSLTPAQQQVALLAVSVENACDFCVVAHRAIGKMKEAKQQTLDVLNENGVIECAQDAALVNFVKIVVKARGHVSEDDIESFLSAGFTKQQIFEVMIIVSIKTLSNYINHLTHTKVNSELLSLV